MKEDEDEGSKLNLQKIKPPDVENEHLCNPSGILSLPRLIICAKLRDQMAEHENQTINTGKRV
jgi:hypothetical protein